MREEPGVNEVLGVVGESEEKVSVGLEQVGRFDRFKNLRRWRRSRCADGVFIKKVVVFV